MTSTGARGEAVVVVGSKSKSGVGNLTSAVSWKEVEKMGAVRKSFMIFRIRKCGITPQTVTVQVSCVLLY